MLRMLTLRQIPQAEHAQALNNLDAFESATIDSSDGIFIAKYPGELGNSLKVSYCTTVDSDNGGVAFNNWTYKGKFDAGKNV